MDIKEAKNKHAAALLSLPNVQSLGIGPRISNGAATGEMAIKVFVSQKVDRSSLTDQECVPQSLEGFPTDVEVIAPMRAR